RPDHQQIGRAHLALQLPLHAGRAHERELAGDLGIRPEGHTHVFPHVVTSHAATFSPRHEGAEYRERPRGCKPPSADRRGTSDRPPPLRPAPPRAAGGARAPTPPPSATARG